MQEERGEIRSRAQMIITNPDMLHQSILPLHGQFATLLSKLKYVIVDEGHAYRWSLEQGRSTKSKNCDFQYKITVSFLHVSADTYSFSSYTNLIEIIAFCETDSKASIAQA